MKHLAQCLVLSKSQQILPVMGITRIIMITATVGSLPARHSYKLPEKNIMFAEGQWDQEIYVSFHFFASDYGYVYIYIYIYIYI